MAAGQGEVRWDPAEDDSEVVEIELPLNWTAIPSQAEYRLSLAVKPAWNALLQGPPNVTAVHIFGVRPGQCPPGTFRCASPLLSVSVRPSVRLTVYLSPYMFVHVHACVHACVCVCPSSFPFSCPLPLPPPYFSTWRCNLEESMPSCLHMTARRAMRACVRGEGCKHDGFWRPGGRRLAF